MSLICDDPLSFNVPLTLNDPPTFDDVVVHPLCFPVDIPGFHAFSFRDVGVEDSTFPWFLVEEERYTAVLPGAGSATLYGAPTVPARRVGTQLQDVAHPHRLPLEHEGGYTSGNSMTVKQKQDAFKAVHGLLVDKDWSPPNPGEQGNERMVQEIKLFPIMSIFFSRLFHPKDI